MPPVQDLTYIVNNSAKKGEKLALLRDVSGFFLPGQMSALVRALLGGIPPGALSVTQQNARFVHLKRIGILLFACRSVFSPAEVSHGLHHEACA